MYTATITGYQNLIETVTYTVRFESDESSFTKDYTYRKDENPQDQLESKVKRELRSLNRGVEPKAYSVVDDNPDTEENKAQIAWQTDLLRYKQLKELVDLGILKGDETYYIKLKDKVTAGFKPRFI